MHRKNHNGTIHRDDSCLPCQLKYLSRIVLYAWRITQRAVCILFLQVIAPAILYRVFSIRDSHLGIGPWLYIASMLNWLVPGFRRYFRHTGTGAHHYTQDIFQIVSICFAFRFVWQPFNRLLDYAVFYFELQCYSDEPFFGSWALYAACVCYLASLYYCDLIGKYWSFEDTWLYPDHNKDVVLMPVPRDNVKLVMAGIKKNVPKEAYRSSGRRRQVGPSLGHNLDQTGRRSTKQQTQFQASIPMKLPIARFDGNINTTCGA